MKPNYLEELQSRRKFIRQAACAAVGTVAMSNVLRDMRFITRALAQTGINSLSPYKALICVFLNGGNDANNMIIPTIPAEWLSYSNTRGTVLALPNTDSSNPHSTALALNSLNGTVGYPANDNHTYGLHPAMPEMQTLFNSGKAAALFNVGTLSYPLTKAQYNSNSVAKPPQLFSHSDQQTQWQTSLPDQPNVSGWGGRMCDLMNSVNQSVISGQTQGQISMAVTLAGSNIFEVGNANASPQYSVNTSTGAVALTGLQIPGVRQQAMQTILTGSPTNSLATGGELNPNVDTDLQTYAYAHVLNHAISEAAVVTTGLGNNSTASWLKYFGSGSGGAGTGSASPGNNMVITPNQTYTGTIGTTNYGFSSSLMAQMQMVARLIDVGSRNYTGVGSYGLGMKRRIFFIQVGGYDTHTVQTSSANSSAPSNSTVIIGQQANLLAELSQTMYALTRAMSDLGLASNVTAFTVSDFARTFPTNGSGSDHGWGSHHFVVGGAVKGQATYGKFPTLVVNGPDDTGLGRWIPTTAVDQYAATLASWFGLDAGNLSTVFPNLSRFASSNLGFI